MAADSRRVYDFIEQTDGEPLAEPGEATGDPGMLNLDGARRPSAIGFCIGVTPLRRT